MVNGVFQAVSVIVELLVSQIFVYHNPKVPSGDFKSRVDFALGGRTGKILVEVKAPHVLEKALAKLERRSLRISLQSGGPSDERVLNKV